VIRKKDESGGVRTKTGGQDRERVGENRPFSQQIEPSLGGEGRNGPSRRGLLWVQKARAISSSTAFKQKPICLIILR